MRVCTPHLWFLPGAAGDPAFWQPVVDALSPTYPCTVQAYPGFAGHAAVPGVHDFASLSDWVLAQLEQLEQQQAQQAQQEQQEQQEHIAQPVVIVAQSMGGILAVQAALRRPDRVRGLVLVATSGGMDVSALGAVDWRSDYALQMAHLPQWFVQARCDLSPDLSRLRLPVLLIWGGADPISPPAVGRFLQHALPHADLVLIPDGKHDVAHVQAGQAARLIRHFLGKLHAGDAQEKGA